MKPIYLIDANVLLRYLLADHPEHYRHAKAFMERLKEGEVRAQLAEGVLVECVYVLLKVYKVPRSEVADTLRALLGYRGWVNDDLGVYHEALQLFDDRRVDIVDGLLYARAQANGWEVHSFDADLKKLRR